MFQFLIPIILIGSAVAGFVLFTSPLYQEISALRETVASYNEALDNAKTLKNERDKLNTKYNSITAENMLKLSKMVPDSVENIR
jgi:hypothetical protein